MYLLSRMITLLFFYWQGVKSYGFGDYKGIMYVSEYEIGGEDFYNNFMVTKTPLLIPGACQNWPIRIMLQSAGSFEDKFRNIKVPLKLGDSKDIREVTLEEFELKSEVGSHYEINANESHELETLIYLPALMVSCRVLYEDFAHNKNVKVIGSKSNDFVLDRFCSKKETLIAMVKGNMKAKFEEIPEEVWLKDGDLWYVPPNRCFILKKQGHVTYIKFSWTSTKAYDTAIDCERPSLHELTKIVTNIEEGIAGEPYHDYTWPDVQMNTGYKMPPVGLGTFRLREKTYETMKLALKLGYRLFDTAQSYSGETRLMDFEISSEFEIGRALFDSEVEREELFLVTKVREDLMSHDDTVNSVLKSLQDLKTNYIDVVLVHAFIPEDHCGPYDKTCKSSPWICWRALEELQLKGLIRSIGVSNIESDTLKFLVGHFSKSSVSVVQNWFDPFHQDRAVREICQEKNITYMGYSTLGTLWMEIEGGYDVNPVLEHKDVVESAMYSLLPTTSAVLRWAISRNVVVIPSTTNEDHLQKNLETRKQNVDSYSSQLIDSLDGLLGDPEKEDWVKPNISFEKQRKVKQSKDEL